MLGIRDKTSIRWGSRGKGPLEERSTIDEGYRGNWRRVANESERCSSDAENLRIKNTRKHQKTPGPKRCDILPRSPCL